MKANKMSFAKTSKVSFSEAKSKLLNSLMLVVLTVHGAAMAADVETTEHKEGKSKAALISG